jgi:hypothetical protein
MPDDAPNVAVAAPEAPAAANAPEPKPFLPPERMQPLLRQLLDSTPEEEAPAEKPEAPKAAASAKAEPPKTPEKPAEPEKPIALRKQKIVRPPLPVAESKAPAPVVDVTPKPDPKWEEALKENEREMLSDAREAAELLPARYKELPGRVEAFLKKHAEFTKKEGFDEQAPDYKAWVEANMPRLSRKEIREIETVRVKNEVQKENDAKLADLKYDFYRKQKDPEIEFRARQLYGELEAAALPKELAEAIKKDGAEKAASAMKLEADVTVAICRAATDDIKEMIRLTERDPDTGRPLARAADVESDPKFQQHARLRVIMDDICNQFRTGAPVGEQHVNNKWFVTREEWDRIPPAQRGQYWTFNNAQIIERMKQRVPGAVALAIDGERRRLESAGWVRKPTEAPKPSAPPPPPTGSAAPRGAPIPGGSDKGGASDIDARAQRLAAAWAKG